MIADSADCAPRSVLIVDASVESREVLRTILARRGLTILEADQGDEGLRLAQRHHPCVIVLDLDTPAATDRPLESEFVEQTQADQASLVVLGRVRKLNEPSDRRQVLSKPYHYGPLVRTIERLVASGQ